MKKTLLILFSCLLATMMISCSINDPNDDQSKAGEFTGKYVVTSDGEMTFSRENAKFEVAINEAAKTLDIKMFQMKFDDNMPVTLNILAKDLPFQSYEDEVIVEKDKVIPTVGGIPMQAFTLENLKIIAGEYKLYVSFKCKGSVMEYNGNK